MPDFKEFIDSRIREVYGNSCFIPAGSKRKQLKAWMSDEGIMRGTYKPGEYYFVGLPDWTINLYVKQLPREPFFGISYPTLDSNFVHAIAEYLHLKEGRITQSYDVVGFITNFDSFGKKLSQVIKVSKEAIDTKRAADQKLKTDLDEILKQLK